MIHLLLHLVVPVLVAIGLYRPRWRSAALVMLATMVVDVDHLLASPIYDPERCSIGFHPLHRVPAIVAYALLLAVPQRIVRLVGLGLLIHMALDALDCVV